MSGHRTPESEKSSTCRRWPQFDHKVIHRFGGKPEKLLPIMNLRANVQADCGSARRTEADSR